MRALSLILGTLGLVGIPVCIILLIHATIKKKPKKHFAIGIFVAFVVAIIGISITPTDNTSSGSVSSSSSKVEFSNTSEVEDDTAVPVDIEPIVDKLMEDVPEYYDEGTYTVEYNSAEKLIVVKIVDPDKVQLATNAINGDQKKALTWNGYGERLKSLTYTWKMHVNNKGVRDVSVMAVIYNSSSQDKELLSAIDGDISVDVVNGIG